VSNSGEEMLSPTDVAKMLGVHVNTVKRMGDRGYFPEYRIGTRKDRRYRASDVLEYIASTKRKLP
jgi:excisionase family DNA binding protein